MAINITFRKDNRIITLFSPGKAPILSRSGAFNFYNSMELLCIAYGSCFGKELWEYCRINNLNINQFESLTITLEEYNIIAHLQHPENIGKDVLDDIERLSRTCQISKQLVNKPILRFSLNTNPN